MISDAHSGLKKAISTVFQGAAWQRCRLPFMRNVLSAVPKGSQDMVASIIRTSFAPPDAWHVNTQFDEVTRMLAKSHPKVAAMLTDARTTSSRSPGSRPGTGARSGPRIPWSGSIRKSKDEPTSSGSSPHPAALRLAAAVLIEPHDDGAAGDRRYLAEASPEAPIEEAILLPELTTA